MVPVSPRLHPAPLNPSRTIESVVCIRMQWAVMVHMFTWEAEAGRCLSSRPTWFKKQVPAQPELLHKEILFQKTEQTEFSLRFSHLALLFFPPNSLCTPHCVFIYLCVSPFVNSQYSVSEDICVEFFPSFIAFQYIVC